MKSFAAKVTSKGHVTVPPLVLEALGLKAGDSVVFHQDETGRFFVEGRAETFADLRGIVTARDCEPVAPVDGARIAGWVEDARGARWNRRSDAAGDEDA